MIIFKKKEKSTYLITNYKVMYSTLKNQGNLTRASGKYLYLKALKSWFFFSKNKYYIIVRDPYKRVESFYKNKFLKAEENRLWMVKQQETKSWQASTEIFFPYLGLNTDMDPTIISKKLVSVKFEEFISILPEVYLKDPHLTPQSFAGRALFKKYGIHLKIPIRFERIYQLESKEDLKEMSKIFNIDINKKFNSTKHIKTTLEWSPESLKTIKRIYHSDFKNFSYKKRS